MDADVLATQGARASTTMIYNTLNRINLVSATKGLRGDMNKLPDVLFFVNLSNVSHILLMSSFHCYKYR